MSDMIERVARAICKTDYDGREWEGLGDQLQGVYREYARAAADEMGVEPAQIVLRNLAKITYTNAIFSHSAGNEPEPILVDAFEYLLSRYGRASLDPGESVSYPREYGEHDLIVPKLHYDALVRAMFDIHRAFYDRDYPKIEAALLACKDDIGQCVDERNGRLFPDGIDAALSNSKGGEG